MKKRNVLSWLAILSITISTLSGCNSGGGDGGSNSNPGSSSNNGSITVPGNSENPVNPVVPGSPEEAVTLKSVVVTANTLVPQAAKGDSVKLFATAVYSNGTHKTVTEEAAWITDTPNILSVSETGEVSTLPETDPGEESDVGTGIVIAQFEGVESEPFKIEVTHPELIDVVVDPRIKSVAAGFNIQLTAWGLYTDNVPRDITKWVTWHTSKEDVLTFNELGLAVGHSIGVAEIQASYRGQYSPMFPIEVTKAELQNITVTPDKFSLPLGTEQKLVVTGHFSDGSMADITSEVTWEETNRSIGRIQDNVFVATEEGAITLTAKHGNDYTANVDVTVTDAVVKEIQVSPSHATIAKGTKQDFKATAIYTNGEDIDVTQKVTWESDDKRILTIDNSTALGQRAGKTVVTASFNGVKSADVPVSVTAAKLTKITIAPSEATLAQYNVKRFHAVGHYSDGSRGDISEVVYWDTNSKGTVALLKDGISNGLTVGDATITASKDGIQATASIQVVDATTVATKIDICGGQVDDTDKRNATGTCLKVASGKNGYWYTSPPSIELMNQLGYRLVDPLKPEAQEPQTYNYIRVEPGSHGPAGDFAMFNNYGLDPHGKTGQWALWCEDLNDKNFAGRNNWRRATMNEMFSLYSKVGGSLWNGENRGTSGGEGLGWPTSFDYWTMTNGHQDYVPYEGEYYDLVNMKNATAWLTGHLRDPAYASCVSEPPKTSTEK